MAYDPAKDGEWFPIPKKGERIACCDCGLVHLVKVSRRAGRAGVTYRRLPYATGGVRRAYGLRKGKP